MDRSAKFKFYNGKDPLATLRLQSTKDPESTEEDDSEPESRETKIPMTLYRFPHDLMMR